MPDQITELIEKFFAKAISGEEMHSLLHAFSQQQISERQLDEYYSGKWNEAGRQLPSPATENREEAWKKLLTHIRRDAQTLPRHKNRWLAVASVAAVAILCFMLGLSLHSIHDTHSRELVVSVENGQKANIQLPDGSHVRLNSASELRYASDFGKKNRIVRLSGEAYFEVESDPSNPFIVQTRTDLHVKALGTKFNVKSYPNDDRITGTLVEGKIEVGNSLFSETLSPNDKITFHTRNGTFRKSHIENADEAIFWMTDQLLFEGETLENIAKILERMYNVTFSFASPDIKEIQYSGRIKNNSMDNVLNLLTTVSPLKYTVSGSQITFSKKQD